MPAKRCSSWGRWSEGVEQSQQLQLALAGAPANDRGAEIARPTQQVAVALLQRDDRPADIRENFPEPDAIGIEAAARCALVTTVELRALGDAAGLAVESGKPPAFAAEPADILVRIAPAGEFPIENAGQLSAVQHVVAGAKIAMAQHWPERRRDVGFEPADCPFEDRPRVRVP